MKRMPCSAFFSSTIPPAGDRKVSVRRISPDPTSAFTSASGTSQLRRRARLDSASRLIPAWASLPASFNASTPLTAIRYSRCADTSSGA